METFPELLRPRIEGICQLSSEQVALLESHFHLLQRWNRKLNLTSLRDPAEIVERHYCESLYLSVHLSGGISRIADIGSGAGFPGFPVGIHRPDSEVTLIESHQRKAVFLKEAVRALPNFRVSAARAEEIPGGFEWAISRAVKYRDVTAVLRRLAPRVALLAGDLAPAEIGWAERFLIPWGRQRYLYLSPES